MATAMRSLEKTSKKCTSCGNVKPLSEYHLDRTRGDGYKARCRTCSSAVGKKQVADRKKAASANTVEQQRKAEARRIALKRLVEIHSREFLKLANEEYRRMNIPAKWQPITSDDA